jgi:hypothetical protein
MYPDLKHWLKIFAKTEIFRENHPGNNNFSRKLLQKPKILPENFCKNENFRESENFRETKFRENEKRVFRFNPTQPTPLKLVIRVFGTFFPPS